jgi:hypothetical protein
VGGRVCIRGRPDAARPWKISRLGDKFVTLMAEDTNGLDQDEHIKIVRLNEIYDANDVIPANPLINTGMMMQQQQHQHPPFSNMMQPQQPTPVNITFAPKLINGGNDNSTAPEVAPVSLTQTQPSGETNFSMPPLIVPKNVQHQHNHNENEDKKGGGGELDFNKGLFIVKKS